MKSLKSQRPMSNHWQVSDFFKKLFLLSDFHCLIDFCHIFKKITPYANFSPSKWNKTAISWTKCLSNQSNSREKSEIPNRKIDHMFTWKIHFNPQDENRKLTTSSLEKWMCDIAYYYHFYPIYYPHYKSSIPYYRIIKCHCSRSEKRRLLFLILILNKQENSRKVVAEYLLGFISAQNSEQYHVPVYYKVETLIRRKIQ